MKTKMCENVKSAINASKLLELFNGSEDNVEYYLSLREALACTNYAVCDPKDEDMMQRLRQSQWKPRVQLKAVEDLEYLDWQGCKSKQTALDDDDNEETEGTNGIADVDVSVSKPMESSPSSFVCGVHGCSQTLSSLASYESHYKSSHNCVCSQCKRVFVSNFLLDLHLSENHDSYFNILSSRIDMYRCLVESCPLKFRTPDLRKNHLIIEHKFPASFSFHHPLKSKSSLSVSKGPIGETDSVMEVETSSKAAHHSKKLSKEKSGRERMECDTESGLRASNTDVTTAGTTSSSSTPLSTEKGKKGGRGRGAGFIPRTICFGRGSQRAFRGHRGGRGSGRGNQNTRVNIEEMEFGDMRDALQD